MLNEIKLGLGRYWRWTSTGPKWHWGVGIGGPLLALLIVISAAGGEEEPANGGDVDSQVIAGDDDDVAPTAQAERPVPTSTPTPLDPVLTQYQTSLLDIFGDYSTAMSGIGSDMQRAGASPGLILTSSWQTSVAVNVALVRVLGDQVRALTPPTCLRDVHALLLRAVTDFDASMELIVQGIDRLSAVSLEAATTRMVQGTDKLTSASALFAGVSC
ncbi:MAG: hypothetical protein GEU75_07430 [Dehalococcoidia bacterium]|nr:hypothetical protein [Dehalococcoidia bacterium]